MPDFRSPFLCCAQVVSDAAETNQRYCSGFSHSMFGLQSKHHAQETARGVHLEDFLQKICRRVQDLAPVIQPAVGSSMDALKGDRGEGILGIAPRLVPLLQAYEVKVGFSPDEVLG